MRDNSKSGDVPRGDDDISGRSVDDGGQLRCESSVSVALADDGATTTIRSRLLNHKELVIEYVTRLNGRVSVIDEREEERFARVLQYGIEHQATLVELADMCCLSLSTFKRRFRERMSMSPHEWFVRQRMILAYRIISEMDISTSELSRLCCFSNASHFITVFKRHYRTTPNRLRRSMNREQERGAE
ncbi:MAG: helix-turn-helix transcriptional regulator [Alistipes sp.]|nr:helix-turn-helix transcriptional regulator [Alistipes sp.]